MGLKERISNRLGRENGEDQSPSDESPEDDSVEDSDDREPNDEEDDRGYERELREFVYLDRDSVCKSSCVDRRSHQTRTDRADWESVNEACWWWCEREYFWGGRKGRGRTG